MTHQTDKGVIDLLEQVLSRLLDSASFKNNIRIVLNNLDPESARQLVRTVMWQDMEFSLSGVAAAPDLINTIIKLLDEVLNQVNDKFPEQVLTEFLGNVVDDIDRETLDRVREKTRSLYAGLAPEIEKRWLTPSGESPQEAAYAGDHCSTASSEATVQIGPQAENVMAAILQAPFLKTIIRETLMDIDPADGARIVQTVMWTDMETMLAVLAALPVLINFGLHAAAEIGTQVTDKMPPDMLIPFVTDMLADIDTEALRKGVTAYQELGRTVLEAAGPSLSSAVHELLTAPAFTQALADGINQGVAGLNRLEADHPGTVRDVMAAVVANTDADAVNTAVRHIADAVLAQRPPIFVIGWRSVKAYIRGFFGRLFRRR
ncbi:MAG: hypothetical protein SWH61_01720 [Thermodesulfobacteriota bacterium]|nr:hypothetical protein [Thermodesulfobacteriota bacterium]